MLARNSKLMTKKMFQYLFPSILMIFAMQFGSLLDGILVGNMIGNDALSATSLVLPILYVVQLPGFAIGTGGSIVVATLLGKREVKKAQTAFVLSMIIAVGVSLIFTILSFFVSEPLARLFCPDDARYIEMGRQYIFIYLLTSPIIAFGLVLASFVGVDNNPRIASLMYIVANVTKVGAEVLFIHLLNSSNYGLIGAALSTPVGYLIGSLLVIFYIKSPKRLLKFSFNFEEPKKMIGESLKASSTTALNLALTAIQMSVCNIFISRLVDPASVDILIFGVLSNMVFVFDLFLGGVIQVIPNICGVLFGEKDYFGLRKITRTLYFINIGITALLMGILALVPAFYCQIFGFDASIDPEKINMFIRMFVLAFLPYEISKFNQMYYPTIGRNVPAYLTVLCRELILTLPLSVILLHTNGMFGYFLGQIVAEYGTILILYTFILIYKSVKKLKKQGVFLIPSSNTIDEYNVTVDNDINNAVLLSQEVKEYALAHKVDMRDATVIALGAEEMVANIIQYGYKIKNHHYYIDVVLKIVEDKMILSIKDDDVIFDPTEYQENEQEFSTSGILLVRKLVDNISYTRVLNTNNTTIEIYYKGAN